MEKVISIGKQNFASLRENHYFFVDKSYFIKDWWPSACRREGSGIMGLHLRGRMC